LHFNELLCSQSQTAARLSAPPFAIPDALPYRCTTRSAPSQQCPNEATTSIWLKAMMVRSDLRGNNETFKMNPAPRGNDGKPKGRSPEGKSGLIPLAGRFARALYLRWNLRAGWGIQLGDTESPCVSPCVSPSVSPCAGRPMAGKCARYRAARSSATTFFSKNRK
jgi:hypothetical protein